MNPPDLGRESSLFLQSLIGQDVIDTEGRTIGQIERVYWRPQVGHPDWAIVSAGLIQKRHLAVPLMDAIFGDKIRVPYLRALINDAAELEQNAISSEKEAELSRHFGVRQDGPEDAEDTRQQLLESWPKEPEAGPAHLVLDDIVTPSSSPSYEAIRDRAYEIYLARGGSHGFDQEDWLNAEKELRTFKAGSD